MELFRFAPTKPSRQFPTRHSRRIIKEANALKILMDDVAEVRERAEIAILMGNKRIAEELAKVPKASGRPSKNIRTQAKNKSGRTDTGIKKDTRSRLGKLTFRRSPRLRARRCDPK
jgi:hypothetical protein